MTALPVSYITSLPLKHNGDCCLLGVTPDLTIYAEETYDAEGWVAQHALRLDGEFVESVDEVFGINDTLQPLPLPDALIKSQSGWQTMALNFAGPRHRGLRGPERALDLVRPLTLQEKMTLVQQLQLDLPPPLVLGLGESYVLAEAMLIRPHLYFVCRRLRIAYALPEEQLDADQQPYDYDTLVLYLAHFYDRGEELSFSDLVTDLTDVPLHRPMDCLRLGDYLFIADGGELDRLSTIHVWRLDLPTDTLSYEEKLRKKIYG